MITGVHHVSMKCADMEEYGKVKAFYCGILGLSVKREWERGCMLDTGAGYVEVMNSGREASERGIITHFALASDDVDGDIEKVRAAGCEIQVEPKDVVLAGDPARIAFFFGLLGEQVELFCEK